MDFFERQDKARRSTKLLVVYFVSGVAMLILVVYLVIASFITGSGLNRHRWRHHEYYPNNDVQLEANRHPLWNPELFLGVAIGTLAVIGIGSAFKTMELARGGSAVSS